MRAFPEDPNAPQPTILVYSRGESRAVRWCDFCKGGPGFHEERCPVATAIDREHHQQLERA